MAAMEEARRLLYEKAIKKFTMQDIIKHHNAPYKNLVQMLSQYPNNGEGFKVWAKWWEPGTFFHVKEVKLFVSPSQETKTTSILKPSDCFWQGLVSRAMIF